MRFNTADIAFLTIEEYTREGGTKPDINPECTERVRMFCEMADLFFKEMETGEIAIDIDAETESLLIRFSCSGVGSGCLTVENVYKNSRA